MPKNGEFSMFDFELSWGSHRHSEWQSNGLTKLDPALQKTITICKKNYRFDPPNDPK